MPMSTMLVILRSVSGNEAPVRRHCGSGPVTDAVARQEDLRDDLLSGEVAHQPLRAGMAEGAIERAADLARDAQGAAIGLGDVDRLDLGGLRLAALPRQPQQPLARAVDRDLLGHDLGPRQAYSARRASCAAPWRRRSSPRSSPLRARRSSSRAGRRACAAASRARRLQRARRADRRGPSPQARASAASGGCGRDGSRAGIGEEDHVELLTRGGYAFLSNASCRVARKAAKSPPSARCRWRGARIGSRIGREAHFSWFVRNRRAASGRQAAGTHRPATKPKATASGCRLADCCSCSAAFTSASLITTDGLAASTLSREPAEQDDPFTSDLDLGACHASPPRRRSGAAGEKFKRGKLFPSANAADTRGKC